MQQVFFAMPKSKATNRQQQWPFRPVTKLLLLTVLLTLLGSLAAAQGTRWDLGAPGSAGATMITGGSGYPPIYAVPGVTLNFCTLPAIGVPCTNFATTYTSLTLASSCPTNAQVVLQNSSACQATGANDGSMGVYLAAGGLYAYTLTVNGVSSGPFIANVPGAPGQAVTPVTTPVSCPASTLFPITSEAQAFIVTLTNNCAASNLTAVAAIVPPALVVFQITSNAHTFTWPANVIGGATVAASGVTTQAFTWDGTNATAIASANLGAGPVQRAGTFDATTGYQVGGAFGAVGTCLQGTGSGNIYGTCNPPLIIANASVTGTTNGTLTKLTGSPSTAVIAATTDTSGAIIGVTVSGGGTTGNANIQQFNTPVLQFDGATTAGDYFINSPTVAGNGHDTGFGPPSQAPLGSLGQVLSTHVGAGAYTVNLWGPGAFLGPLQGTDANVPTSGTFTGGTGSPICKDGNGGISTCGAAGVNTPQYASTAGLPVALTANTQATVLSKSVTFPTGTGTYRADLRSGLWITAGPNACATEIIDATNTKAYASGNSQNANGSGLIGITGAEITSATYASGATVTFNLAVICNANSTATLDWALGTATFSPLEHSFLQITPIPSN